MNEEIDCTYTSDLVCPYCGQAAGDTFELPETGDVQCHGCEKFFVYSSELSRTFSSSKAECLNGGEHDWGKFNEFTGCKIRYCRTCDKRDFVNTSDVSQQKVGE